MLAQKILVLVILAIVLKLAIGTTPFELPKPLATPLVRTTYFYGDVDGYKIDMNYPIHLNLPDVMTYYRGEFSRKHLPYKRESMGPGNQSFVMVFSDRSLFPRDITIKGTLVSNGTLLQIQRQEENFLK